MIVDDGLTGADRAGVAAHVGDLVIAPVGGQ
jgi:hypothetical protein